MINTITTKMGVVNNRFTQVFGLLISLWLLSLTAQPAFAKTAVTTLLNDVGKLATTRISRVVHVRSEEDIINAIQYAKNYDLTISIAGKQHSQGGHTLSNNSVNLDMKSYNKILSLNVKDKSITVQSGTTWREIQESVNKHGLAVKVMQSSNIFTVGGSVSVNAHGRDPNFGPIIETIRSLKFINCNGALLNVSRQENYELFKAIIGGYGLFGVITEITLELTDNVDLRQKAQLIQYTNLNRTIDKAMATQKSKTEILFARMSIYPGDTFLREMYFVEYIDTGAISQKALKSPAPSLSESAIAKPFFNFSRESLWGKKARWKFEKRHYNKQKGYIDSRNNVMNPPIDFLLKYNSKRDVDLLQEYFIPRDKVELFIDGMRNIMVKYKVNLLNVTVRLEPKNSEALLSYAPDDSIAVVLYFNQLLNADDLNKAKIWTRQLIDLSQKLNGRYYLTYQNWATRSQFKLAYPQFDVFNQLKKKHDPDGLFTNRFYELYQ